MLIIYKSKLLRFEKALDTIAKRKIINVNDLLSFDSSEIREYQKLTKDTQLWHGTGRWQHGEDGIVDVMKSFAILLASSHPAMCMQFLAAVIGISYIRFHYAGVGWWRDHMLTRMVLAGKRKIAMATL